MNYYNTVMQDIECLILLNIDVRTFAFSFQIVIELNLLSLQCL